MLRFDPTHMQTFIRESEVALIMEQAERAKAQLHQQSGAGNEFLGWIDLPTAYDKAEFEAIQKAAKHIREEAEVLIVAGIGGSYLGARAVIEALSPAYRTEAARREARVPEIIFVGQQLSPGYLQDVLRYVAGRELCVNVISKSGSTTETAVAFRLLKAMMEERYGQEEAAKRIYATTDRSQGAMKALADAMGYSCFVVPDDVGGRFSVLTAVGLLPIAVAGIDIHALMEGASVSRARSFEGRGQEDPALLYAVYRNLALRRGYKVEVLANFEPALVMMNEWWKQLYGESEGKDGKGLFPASVSFTTDLHSMGQLIQDGPRMLFETFLVIDEVAEDLILEEDQKNLDGLNYLAGKGLADVNEAAMKATRAAHLAGGVPVGMIHLPQLTAHSLGQLIYFFETACGISAYLNGVNPFDQPGVEAYKTEMFRLLGKPGYEA